MAGHLEMRSGTVEVARRAAEGRPSARACRRSGCGAVEARRTAGPSRDGLDRQGGEVTGERDLGRRDGGGRAVGLRYSVSLAVAGCEFSAWLAFAEGWARPVQTDVVPAAVATGSVQLRALAIGTMSAAAARRRIGAEIGMPESWPVTTTMTPGGCSAVRRRGSTALPEAAHLVGGFPLPGSSPSTPSCPGRPRAPGCRSGHVPASRRATGCEPRPLPGQLRRCRRRARRAWRAQRPTRWWSASRRRR